MEPLLVELVRLPVALPDVLALPDVRLERAPLDGFLLRDEDARADDPFDDFVVARPAARRVESADARRAESLEVDWAVAVLARPSVTTAAIPQTVVIENCFFIGASPAVWLLRAIVAVRWWPPLAASRCEAGRVPAPPRRHENRLTVALATHRGRARLRRARCTR
jgi:hypothetical protein